VTKCVALLGPFSMRFEIRHHTQYRYSQRIRLSPHQLRFHHRDDHSRWAFVSQRRGRSISWLGPLLLPTCRLPDARCSAAVGRLRSVTPHNRTAFSKADICSGRDNPRNRRWPAGGQVLAGWRQMRRADFSAFADTACQDAMQQVVCFRQVTTRCSHAHIPGLPCACYRKRTCRLDSTMSRRTRKRFGQVCCPEWFFLGFCGGREVCVKAVDEFADSFEQRCCSMHQSKT
jgi:hypothetical protein